MPVTNVLSFCCFRWAQSRHKELKLRGSSLEFRLHKLKFLDLLKEGRHKDALEYSKHFARFAADHTKGRKSCTIKIRSQISYFHFANNSEARAKPVKGTAIMNCTSVISEDLIKVLYWMQLPYTKFQQVNKLSSSSLLRNGQFVNPLSPDIKMHILITDLHTFLMKLVRRICLNTKTSYPE